MIVAIYARVSTDRQTTDNQIIRLRQWAERNEWTIHDEYVDIRSGRDTRRPELTRMLDDAKKRLFDLIIAVRLDRIGRSVTHLAEIIQSLEKWNVGLRLLDQAIDTTTAMGKFMFTIISAVAEFERDLIVDRVNDGLERARKEGKTLGRPQVTLSDYQVEKARRILAENPKISQRQLAEQFEGISRPTLIEGLKQLGLLPDSGKKTLSEGVYKETKKKSVGKETTD